MWITEAFDIPSTKFEGGVYSILLAKKFLYSQSWLNLCFSKFAPRQSLHGD
jgi:hypothetical protein